MPWQATVDFSCGANHVLLCAFVFDSTAGSLTDDAALTTAQSAPSNRPSMLVGYLNSISGASATHTATTGGGAAVSIGVSVLIKAPSSIVDGQTRYVNNMRGYTSPIMAGDDFWLQCEYEP